MKAAIYARKSTDKMEGIDAQVSLARSFIAKQGWEVGPEFKDNDSSGAEFNRPGLNALLAGLTAHTFDLVVMMEASRLGREQAETLMLQVRITGAGVRIFHYQDGQELQVSTPTQKLVASVANFGAEDFRYQIRLKTAAALRHKASQGYAAGRPAFGYTTHAENRHKVYEVNQAEAEVVRQIFKLTADGWGSKKIAEHLANGMGATTIRHMLANPVYKGLLVYGVTVNVTKTKKARATLAPVQVPAPHLALVTPELWQAAQDRMKVSRLKHPGVKGVAAQVRDGGQDSVHLLSGFLRCGACGAGMSLISNGKGGRWWRCTRVKLGTATKLDCRKLVAYADLESAVRRGITAKEIQQATIAWLKTLPTDDAAPVSGKEFKKAQAQVRNLTKALADGYSKAVSQALRDAEAQVERLSQAQASAQAVAEAQDDLDPEALADEVTEGLQRGLVTVGRDVLRGLGATITVDAQAREVVMAGTVGKMVTRKLGLSHAQLPWAGRG